MSEAKIEISLKYEVFQKLIQKTNAESNKIALKLAGNTILIYKIIKIFLIQISI